MASPDAAYGHCEALLRAEGQTRPPVRAQYLASLYAPPSARRHLQALAAFWQEIAGISAKISNVMAGEIRLQYWLELLAKGADAAGNPLGEAILATIAQMHLPKSAFTDMIEARIGDLYDDPMPDLAALEHYCGAIYGAQVRLNTLILAGGGRDPGGAAACGHAGMALGLTEIIQQMPANAALSAKMAPVAGDDPAKLRRLALEHLHAALAASRALPTPLAVAFLPLALVAPRVTRPIGDISPLRQQWCIWRAAARL
ncbi:MAG: squalene/phytoene synthase family protein [Hyphomicrobiales bacterium]|nr:squalene/phytoene synthase family protein [Hyphomicrobiales bacterium]MDE2114844.1 squalene/phytoene synthase family protein [Hyphomicrobiales bacterium]